MFTINDIEYSVYDINKISLELANSDNLSDYCAKNRKKVVILYNLTFCLDYILSDLTDDERKLVEQIKIVRINLFHMLNNNASSPDIFKDHTIVLFAELYDKLYMQKNSVKSSTHELKK